VAGGGGGRLLDLACGTGQVCLSMHRSFAEVWAVDQEPDMIAFGRKKADTLGASQVKWMVGRAEELEAPAGHFELVTIGSAFHRLDRPLVARRVQQWLPRGRYLAIVGASSVWTGTESWQALAVEVINRWTRPRPKGQGKSMTPAEVLAAVGYDAIEERTFAVPHRWSLDDFIGYLHSTSVASRSALGGSATAFEADLRRTLLRHDPAGLYQEQMTGLKCGSDIRFRRARSRNHITGPARVRPGWTEGRRTAGTDPASGPLLRGENVHPATNAKLCGYRTRCWRGSPAMTLVLHITAGLISIATGAVALYAFKGGKLHRNSGKVFVAAMLVMAFTGLLMSVLKAERLNAAMGVLTIYMVTTALLTVRPPGPRFRWVDHALMMLGLSAGLYEISLGLEGLNSPSGRIDGMPATPAFVFGSLALLAAAGDLRVLLAGPLQGAQRIARHLWRMCFAMFIATGSLFLGQPDVFPVQIRGPLLAAPVLAVLVSFFYWLGRVLFTRRYRQAS
jgi:SAM-dependent methyltransferase